MYRYLIISMITTLIIDSGCRTGSPPSTARNQPVAESSDLDADGIVDQIDQCPDQAEVFNGYADDDGCPDVVDHFPITKFEIPERIFFKQGEWKIQQVSFQVMDAVALFLIEVPKIKLVRIEGHKDSSEADPEGSDLSLMRAEAVRDYLVEKGVDGGRLETVGLGDTKPAPDAEGDDPAAYHRRVEFVIVEMEEEPDE